MKDARLISFGFWCRRGALSAAIRCAPVLLAEAVWQGLRGQIASAKGVGVVCSIVGFSGTGGRTCLRSDCSHDWVRA